LHLFWRKRCVAAFEAMRFSVRSFGCALFYFMGKKDRQMEEKTLLKSERFKPINVFALSILLAIVVFLGGIVINYASIFSCKYIGIGKIFVNSFHFLLKYGFDDWSSVGLFAAIGLVVFGFISYYAVSKVELIVTDKSVYGKAAFGKQVYLPIDSVSFVKISMFKGISIGTSSGLISFWRIRNRDAIYEVLLNLLVERQNKNTAVTPVIEQEIP